MALGLVQGHSKFRHDTADDGLCADERCHKRRLVGREYCEAHELQAEQVRDRFGRVSAPRNLLYFIGVDGEDVVKIGRTNDIDCRLKTLQTGNHKELVLLAAIEAPAAVEPWVHGVLIGCHLRGEWFRRTEKVNQIIEAAKSGSWDTFFQSFV